MRNSALGTRAVLLILAALLALPLAQTASPVEAKKRARTATRTFANPAGIDLPVVDSNGLVSGSLYPSPIAVRDLKGAIRDVNLRLNDVSHTFPADLFVLLVGPGGQTARDGESRGRPRCQRGDPAAG